MFKDRKCFCSSKISCPNTCAYSYLCTRHPPKPHVRSRIPHPAALTAKAGNTRKDRTTRCYPKPDLSATQYNMYLRVQGLSTAGFGGCEDVPDRGDGCRGLLPQLGFHQLPSLHTLRTCTSNSVQSTRYTELITLALVGECLHVHVYVCVCVLRVLPTARSLSHRYGATPSYGSSPRPQVKLSILPRATLRFAFPRLLWSNTSSQFPSGTCERMPKPHGAAGPRRTNPLRTPR